MSLRQDRGLAALVEGLDIRYDVIDGESGPIRVRRYDKCGGARAATLVWAHGGGFVHGDLEMSESHAVAAAVAQTGLSVVAVGYSLVSPWPKKQPFPIGPLPGVRYPVPVNEMLDVYRQVVVSSVGPVSLGGASAGACLAATAAMRLARRGETPPTDLVLAYGSFHAALPPIPPEIRASLRGASGWFAIRPDAIGRINRNYAGSDPAMREAFPGDQDLTGMPPTLMIDAERDSLRASGSLFASQLRRAGVDVDYQVVRGAIHGFLNLRRSPRFVQGIELIADRLLLRTA